MHALDHAAPALERHLVEADDRDPVEVLERGADRRVLHDVGDDLQVDALVAQPLDERHEPGVVLERQRHVDLVGLRALDRVARVVDRPDDRQPGVARRHVLALAEEADDAVAERGGARAASRPRCARARRCRPRARASGSRPRPTAAPARTRSAARPKLISSDVEQRRRARTPPGCTPRAAPPRAGSGSRRGRRASRRA